MLALVRRARQRILQNLALAEGANAASAALLAFILLLVLGTEVLKWYWVLLLPVAALGVAIWRVRRRSPSLYRVAQTVDQRLHLADLLSTSLYFSSEQVALKVSPELRRLQRAEAERVATEIDVRQAVPYRMPRTAYLTAALLLVASSVFALRYGLTERLDLKQPLAMIVNQRLGYGEKDQRAKLDPRRSPGKLPSDDQLAAQDGEATPPADAGQPQDDATENPADQAKNNAAKSGRDPKDKQAQNDAGEDGQADQSEQPDDGQQEASNPKEGQKEGKDSKSGGQNSQGSQGNQSLLSKMKEAMQNLMSSLQQPQNSKDQQQSASNQNGKTSKGQQSGSKQQGKREKNNSQAGDQQDQQAADGQEAQNADGQSSERQDSPLANKQPGSGAGNRDGSKDVRAAEQLAAMGKISEIIGKRAANVTGEATVDVQTTSQQLKTSYQDRRAEHSQTGAEINRDEIPVALESYVEQYFEQVRKQAPAVQK